MQHGWHTQSSPPKSKLETEYFEIDSKAEIRLQPAP
jgi:hypothetical protein